MRSQQKYPPRSAGKALWKQCLTLFLALVLCLALLPMAVAAEVGSASPWAQAELEEAERLGLVPEVLKGQDLTRPITRAEFAAVAVRVYETLTGTAVAPAENAPFTDTDDTDVLKAYRIGVVNGTSATTYGPDTLLDREQLAAMLTRVLKKVYLAGWSLQNDQQFALSSGSSSVFADDAEISRWAKDSVYFMAGNSVLGGVGGGKFAPMGTAGRATREQALVIAVRAVHSITEETIKAAVYHGPKANFYGNVPGMRYTSSDFGVYAHHRFEGLEGDWKHASEFSYGMAAVSSVGEYDLKVEELLIYHGKWGFIDTTGKLVIPMEYDYVYKFNSFGLALVGKYYDKGAEEWWANMKWGYIDRAGKVVIPIEYDMIGEFLEDDAVAAYKGDYDAATVDILNSKGEVLNQFDHSYIGIIPVEQYRGSPLGTYYEGRIILDLGPSKWVWDSEKRTNIWGCRTTILDVNGQVVKQLGAVCANNDGRKVTSYYVFDDHVRTPVMEDLTAWSLEPSYTRQFFQNGYLFVEIGAPYFKTYENQIPAYDIYGSLSYYSPYNKVYFALIDKNGNYVDPNSQQYQDYMNQFELTPDPYPEDRPTLIPKYFVGYNHQEIFQINHEMLTYDFCFNLSDG